MARLWRAFHEKLPRESGASVPLSIEESRHVRRALRLRAGERLAIFDGTGVEWLATILPGDSGPVTVRLDEVREDDVEPGLEIVLFQGNCRGPQFEWVIQKATEVGCAEVSPLLTERAEKLAVRAERWRRVAIESCKQCGRRIVPRIEVRHEVPPLPPGTVGLLLDPSEGAAPIGGVLARESPETVWIVCGPEAGLAPEELDRWSGAGWTRVGLGPRILRTETAGIVAVALVAHRWGDLGSKGRV